MMGYANMNQTTAGVHFRLRARTFIVAESSKGPRFAFVNLDAGMASQLVNIKVLEKLKSRYLHICQSNHTSYISLRSMLRVKSNFVLRFEGLGIYILKKMWRLVAFTPTLGLGDICSICFTLYQLWDLSKNHSTSLSMRLCRALFRLILTSSLVLFSSTKVTNLVTSYI